VRREGKICQLIVEEKATDEEARAEAGLDRRRHRNDVALAVDNGDLAGRRQFGRTPVRPEARMRKFGRAGFHLGQL
jgi:hypothetical protein